MSQKEIFAQKQKLHEESKETNTTLASPFKFDNAKKLAEIKKQFKEFGIYLFPCNKCNDGLQALHIEKCLLPGCGGINNFY